ncbi:hypothetical protein M9H77_25681 [Catharanthus roseus]|uniref:Uncharacterized protein n=1 Tax=Catharanthus roseus TaxID=4058 RepID=A0ACC0ABS8_CATRO|nr:hypothetical protein M9H77_25681 [Catharanthus roseus]
MSSAAIYSRLRRVFPNTVNSTSSSIRSKLPAKTSISRSSQDHQIGPLLEPKTSLSKPLQVPQIESIVANFKKSSDRDNFRRRYSQYEATVRRLANAQQFSAIKDILEHQRQYPDITKEHFVVRLIVLYGKAKMLDEAQKLFDEMPSLNCERTVLSFNALLAACVSAKDYDKISKLLKELPEKLSIQPNVVSYNTVIKGLCEMGSLDSAVSMMDEMENNNIMPDLITFNTLLDAFYSAGRNAEAENLWCLMEKKDLVANVRSYNSRLRGFVKDNRISDAVLLTEEMEAKGVKLDTYSYNALIKGFIDSGNLEEAKRWYGLMTENGCTPDWVTFAMLVPFACKEEDFDYAYQLCKQSIRVNRKVLDSVTTRVINGLIERKKHQQARKLMNLAKIEFV